MRKDVLMAVKRFKRDLKKLLKDNLIDVRAFGSRIRGNFHFWSDLDVLVVVKKRTPTLREKIIGLTMPLEEKLGFSIHPVILTEREWLKELSLQTELSQSILQQGLKI